MDGAATSTNQACLGLLASNTISLKPRIMRYFRSICRLHVIAAEACCWCLVRCCFHIPCIGRQPVGFTSIGMLLLWSLSFLASILGTCTDILGACTEEAACFTIVTLQMLWSRGSLMTPTLSCALLKPLVLSQRPSRTSQHTTYIFKQAEVLHISMLCYGLASLPLCLCW